MPILPALTTYVDGQILPASSLNSDFGALRTYFNSYAVLTDVARTITAVHTYSAAPVFSAGFSTAAGVTIGGNSTLTGTLTGLTGLTVASGGAVITAGGLTVTAGGATLTAGNLALAAGQGYSAQHDCGTSGTALAIDWNTGNVQKVTLTGNVTFTFANPVAGAIYTLRLVQDATGSRTVTWPATVKWAGGGTAPVLTTTAGRTDILSLLYNGTNYEAALVGLGWNS